MIGFWLFNIISALAVSAVTTIAILNLVQAKAFVKKHTKSVRLKDMGTSPFGTSIPLWGIILVPVTLLSTMVVFGADSFWNAEYIRTLIITSGVNLFFLLCALMVIYMVGLCCDFSRVGKSTNLMLQLVCAFFILLSGLETAYSEANGNLIGELPQGLSVVVTIFLVLAAINWVSVTAEGFKNGIGIWISQLLILYYGILLFVEGDYLSCTITAAFSGASLVGCFFSSTNSFCRLGSTGRLTMGIVLAMMAIRASQHPIDGAFGFKVWVISLAPIAILLLWAIYSTVKGRHLQKNSDR